MRDWIKHSVQQCSRHIAHLFDFAEEIYGSRVRVEFMAKIRPERRFESFEALKEQIALDSTAARRWFEDQRGQGQIGVIIG